ASVQPLQAVGWIVAVAIVISSNNDQRNELRSGMLSNSRHDRVHGHQLQRRIEHDQMWRLGLLHHQALVEQKAHGLLTILDAQDGRIRLITSYPMCDRRPRAIVGLRDEYVVVHAAFSVTLFY